MDKKQFNWNATLYQKNSSFQFNLGLMAIEKLSPKANENILEIGCGNAMLTIELSNKLLPYGKITALDLSEEMLNQAKANLEKYNITNVNLININAINIKCENIFDAVFSNSAIHWINNLELMYSLIYKALKQNGRLVIQTGLKENNSLFKSLLKIIKVKEFKPYFKNFTNPWRFLTLDETERLLESISFKKIHIEPYNYKQIFNNQNDLVNFFKAAALVPFLNSIPTQINENFLDKFKEIYFEFVGKNNLIVNMTRLFIYAKK